MEFSKDVFFRSHTPNPATSFSMSEPATHRHRGVAAFTAGGRQGQGRLHRSSPATFEILERVYKLNNLTNVECVHAALMDTSGEPIAISNMRKASARENRVGGTDGIPVPTITMTSWSPS